MQVLVVTVTHNSKVTVCPTFTPPDDRYANGHASESHCGIEAQALINATNQTDTHALRQIEIIYSKVD